MGIGNKWNDYWEGVSFGSKLIGLGFVVAGSIYVTECVYGFRKVLRETRIYEERSAEYPESQESKRRWEIREKKVEDYTQRMFKNFDLDNDGLLSAREISNLAKKAGYDEVIPADNLSIETSPFGSGIGLNLSSSSGWKKQILVSEEKLEELANYK